MRAIMLAAGLGRRLYGDAIDHPHKALNRFGGETLLARHIRILQNLEVQGLDLIVGFRADDLRQEIMNLGACDFVRCVENPDYHLGTGVSLLQAAPYLEPDQDVLIMDADVLYPQVMLERLITSQSASCLLLDSAFSDGEEPVKVCIRDHNIVDFGKKVASDFWDVKGEWPGFLKLCHQDAKTFFAGLGQQIAVFGQDEPMEKFVRQFILEFPQAMGWIDIKGMPWIEIDFPEDLLTAQKQIFALIQSISP